MKQFAVFPMAGVLWSALVVESLAIAAGPYSPEEAAAKFVIDADCRIELVAAEPDVIDPVALAFGADGRLWVVEYSDYPSGAPAGEPGRSRVRVLEDADGDGRYDQARIFAEHLLFANGLMLWKDGAIVTTDGKVLFLRDSDGDGRADETQVWFEGFRTDNPQLRCNHPTLGSDNRIYVANGLRGGEIVPGASNPWQLDPASKPLSLSGMDFRFDPLTGAYEAISGMGQFGLTFDDWGNRFECDNRHPCKQILLQDADLREVPWLQPKRLFADVSPAEEKSRLFPISRIWTTSNLHANQFTAACGVQIYRGDALPSRYYGNCFVCEPTANLVHRDVLKPARACYIADPHPEEREFLSTRDEWFRPVNLTVGPDGALYLCDMYRAVIEHPEFMPAELRQRPDLLLGNDQGRIWRITAKNPAALHDFTFSHTTHLEHLGSAELVELLQHPNQWQRETAQRLLLERQDATVGAELRAMLQNSDSHWGGPLALWTLEGLHLLQADDIAAGLRHPFAKRAALQLGRRHFSTDPAFREFPVTHLAVQAPFDEDPHLLEQILVNTRWKDLPPRDQASHPYYHNPRGALLLSIPEDGQHEWYCSLLVIHAGDDLLHVCEELFAILRRGETPGTRPIRTGPATVAFLSAALARRHQPEELQKYLQLVVLQPTDQPQERAWQRAALSGIMNSAPDGPQQLAAAIANLDGDAVKAYSACLNEVLFSFVDPQPGRVLPLEQLQLLTLLPPQETVPVLKRLAATADAEVVTASIQVLGQLAESQAVAELGDLMVEGMPQVRRNAMAALLKSPPGRIRLLEAVEAGQVAPLEVDPAAAKQLMESRDPELRERAVAALKVQPPEDRIKVLADYAGALTMAADPHRGKLVFERACATCHRIGSVGVNVAPDISDSRVKTTEFLLTNILDPNRAIDNNYFSFTIADQDGLVYTGVIAGETSTAVTLKQPGGTVVTIPRDQIDQMKNNRVSLMPVGLERTISPQEMADLLSFIKNWRYLDGQVPGEVIQKTELK